MAEKKSLREHVIYTAIGTLVTLAVTGLVTTWLFPSFRRWLLATPTMLSKFGSWLAVPVEVTRWHYWLALSLLILVAGFVVVAIASAALSRKVPSFLDYTEDRFFGATWRWRWIGNQIETYSIRPYCLICDREMV